MIYRAFFILVFAVFCLNNSTFGQFDPNPELDFYTIETEHFYIHYHKGTERTANAVAKIAEDIYGPITALYNYRPSDKTSFIINDESDYSNGATDYYGNRIEIAAVALDFDLRGTHNWLRNVITHEFTHVIQVPASMKFFKQMPSIYLQWLNYENERRPDVLYGYPNVIASYPISGVSVPAWYAEGTAQYQRQQLGYDFWDAHRDMILRTRSLDNDLVTYEDMGQFASVTTYKAESIYNAGFGFVMYISGKYGEDKLREVSEYMGNPVSFNAESAFKKATGKTGKELYNEWKAFLKQDYGQKTANLKKLIVSGDNIADIGFANYYPQFSPDGKKISYLSNKTYDYGATTLFFHNVDGKGEDEAKISGISGSYAWTPDGKNIIYARRNKPTIHEKSIFDLYEYNLKDETEEQITTNLRAHSPAISSDGKKVAFIVNKDGSQNICVADYKHGEKIKSNKKLTSNNNGEQIYSLKWSPDGNTLIFDFSLEGGRSIRTLDVNTLNTEILFADDNIDYRNPVYSHDGKYVYFTSDATGIYNVYRYELPADSITTGGDKNKNPVSQMTNVLGGAFMPAVDTNGNLTFASFKSTGYKINLLKSPSVLDSSIAALNANYERPNLVIEKYALENDSNSSSAKNKFAWEELKKFNDKDPFIKSKAPYNNVATPLFFIPVLRFDNYTKDNNFADLIKPGLYFYSQDVLGRMGIFGGASMNRKFERDLFLQFEYNNGVPFFKDFFLKTLGFAPHFTLSGYNITRKTNADLVAGLDTIPVDITYDLLEFDFDMAFKIINSNHTMKAGFTISRYSSKLGEFIIPRIGQIPASSTNYFNGRDISLTYSYNNMRFDKNDDINPVGRYVKFKYDYEFNYLNPHLEINDEGNAVETFAHAKFSRLEGLWSETLPLFNTHSIGLTLKGGTIFGPQQDNFFDFYATGFPGMKGYPFYALGGNKYATANLTYRFPLATGLDFNFLQFYFDKMYLSVYGDIGNAWNGDATKLKEFKKDFGAELRLQTYSYYVYPTSFAFNAAYGVDQFSKLFPSTTGEEKVVTYGKEWRFYFTMLFGFDFINDFAKKMRF
ncbi:MAG: biopolymer transporter Tol [Ignavibacteriae bacterium]|nr:MAG: biopolymer transporter Tol [Ignavibacteriota bacterium]